MFSTPEDADRAWEEHKKSKAWKDKLQEGHFPQRHIETLQSMHGPSLQKAEELLPRLLSNGILFLIGDRGPGKTQMATWLAWRLVKSGTSVRYSKMLDFLGALKSTWGDGKGNEAEVLRKHAIAGFLCLDEAQERGDSENDRAWGERNFTLLVDHRYDAMLPTIIVANYTPDQYRRDVPASIRSRISETGGVVNCDWPSYRK